MLFNLRDLAKKDRYKLLVGLIVPRPIALVTSRNHEGKVNAAPFSFFNLMGTDPPVVVLGVGDRNPGSPKDTAQNIAESGEFVVNLVDEPLAKAMNICGADFPSGEEELVAAGLTPAPCTNSKIPRIAESPASLECIHRQTVLIGRTRVLLGEGVVLHVRDELVDPVHLHIDGKRLRAIGRLHGAGWYTRTSDQFEMPRISYEEWLTKSKVDDGSV